MPEPRPVLEVRRSVDFTDPNPDTAEGDRVLVWIEGVVLRTFPRTRDDGTVEHVRVLDPDRLHAAMIVSSP